MEHAEQCCVKVRADFNTLGQVMPVKVKWVDAAGDEHIFNITKVLDVCPGASLKVGVAGLRYTVLIGGKNAFLFLVENKWYLEV